MEDYITRAEHGEFARRLEADNRRQDRRIENLEEAQKETNALVTSVEKLALSVQQMCRELESQGKRLTALEGRDGELWRKVVGCVVTGLVGAVLGFVCSKIGLS